MKNMQIRKVNCVKVVPEYWTDSPLMFKVKIRNYENCF